DRAAAAEALAHALRVDPSATDIGFTHATLRKHLARSLLRLGRPAEAEAGLKALAATGPDPEVDWLLSRAALQRGDKAAALAAWKRAAAAAGAGGPPRCAAAEPAPSVGAARCAECHREVHDDQQASRHARTFHRAGELAALNLPAQTAADPDNPGVVADVSPDRLRVRAGAA